MKSILLIGMGKFGQTLGTRLLNMGDEVMIVDKNEDIINALAPKYTNALIANCMNADNLSTMDIPSFDVCVVAIGDDFQSSLEITSRREIRGFQGDHGDPAEVPAPQRRRRSHLSRPRYRRKAGR